MRDEVREKPLIILLLEEKTRPSSNYQQSFKPIHNEHYKHHYHEITY